MAGVSKGRVEWVCQRCLREPIAQPPCRPTFVLVLLAMLLSLTMYPVLKSLGLHLHSALTGSYVPGHHSVLLVNCPNEQIAKSIARDIMEKRMAASINILPRTFVLYFWRGEIQDSTEILLLVKTRTSEVQKVTDFVKSVHPYGVPEVLSFPVEQGNPPYMKWMDDAVPGD